MGIASCMACMHTGPRAFESTKHHLLVFLRLPTWLVCPPSPALDPESRSTEPAQSRASGSVEQTMSMSGRRTEAIRALPCTDNRGGRKLHMATLWSWLELWDLATPQSCARKLSKAFLARHSLMLLLILWQRNLPPKQVLIS